MSTLILKDSIVEEFGGLQTMEKLLEVKIINVNDNSTIFLCVWEAPLRV